jgi:glucosamine-6-phosphate deaminase
MVLAVRAKQVSFAEAEVFALDEFGDLPTDDPGTCRNMLLRDLVRHVDLPASGFHWFNPANPDLESECAAYDKLVGPGFDLVLLGLGTNGHLGMNEPGSRANSPTRRTELHDSTIAGSAKYLNHGKLPTWGLTVGMQQFFNSREVWAVATGTAKAEIIHTMVRGEITEQVPASLLRRHSNCSLFVDREAGARLG